MTGFFTACKNCVVNSISLMARSAIGSSFPMDVTCNPWTILPGIWSR